MISLVFMDVFFVLLSLVFTSMNACMRVIVQYV
jgi:hypothetical protein